MAGERRPVIHGRDHEHGGADPTHVVYEDVGGGALASARHIILDELPGLGRTATELPDRPKLAFVGSGVTATDDEAEDTTVVTIAPRTLLAVWGGELPAAAGDGLIWRVPYQGDGTALTFTLSRAYARLEPPEDGGSTVFQLESSPGGEAAFTPTTIVTLTVPASEYEAEATGLTDVVSSGDLLRLVFETVRGSGNAYQVELTGGES